MNKLLYIIGNGFDIHHGIRSDYQSFKEYLIEKDSALVDELELFFDSPDIWGDFENNLAYLSRERLLEYADLFLKDLDQDADDFLAADYLMALGHVHDSISACTATLRYRFHKWIRSLYLPKGHKRFMIEIEQNATFINFNYTDTLEVLYQIPNSDIAYLHGCKNDSHHDLVLGHGGDPERNFDEWFHKNKNKRRFRHNIKNKRGKYYANDGLTYLAYFLENEEKGNWITPLRYYAVDQLVGRIEEYYKISKKKFDDVLLKFQHVFLKLETIENIVVLGHSFHKVDYPYFEKILGSVSNPEKLEWHISYYSESDLVRINRFLSECKISISKINLFMLADRQVV